MTSEVCPFCGKTYKRLKSHLPHCKAAAKSKASQAEHHDRTDQTTPQLVAGSSGPTAKAEKASPTSEASKKSATAGSAPPGSSSPTKSVKSEDASSPSSLSPTSPPPPMKKKKQKLSEQIKMATAPASSTSLTSFPELSPSSTIPKPKKKSLRTAKEEAKSDHVVQGLLDGTRSAPGDLQTGSNPSLTDPPESRAKAGKETSVIPARASLTPLPSDKPKDLPQRKTSKTKSSGQTPPTTNDHEFLDSDINKSSTTPRETDDFWLDNLSEENTFLKSGGGDQARITIQGVKATLGRAKTSSRSNGSIILNQIETSEHPSRKTQLDNGVSLVTAPAGNKKDVVRNSVTTKTQSDRLPSLTTQQPKPRSIIKTDLKPKQVALIPLHHEGSSQPKPTVPAPVGHLLPVSVSEGLKVGRHVTELPSISLSHIQFSSPHLAHALPARVEPLTTDDELRLEDRKRAAAHSYCEGALARRRLGQVRLRELPEWLACKTPGHPREVVEMARQGWHWYYRRYIDVKKGGVGGLGMLLAGYCVLSYIWNYPHIKRDRWRKYH